MSGKHENMKPGETSDKEQSEKVNPENNEEQIIIKIPPQLTALRKAAEKGDPYCEVVEENDIKAE